MNQQNQPKVGARLWLSLALRMAGFAVALLWPAGTWRWWEAWALIGLWTAFAVAATYAMGHLMKSRPLPSEER